MVARDFVTIGIPIGGYSIQDNKFLVEFPHVPIGTLLSLSVCVCVCVI